MNSRPRHRRGSLCAPLGSAGGTKPSTERTSSRQSPSTYPAILSGVAARALCPGPSPTGQPSIPRCGRGSSGDRMPSGGMVDERQECWIARGGSDRRARCGHDQRAGPSQTVTPRRVTPAPSRSHAVACTPGHANTAFGTRRLGSGPRRPFLSSRPSWRDGREPTFAGDDAKRPDRRNERLLCLRG